MDDLIWSGFLSGQTSSLQVPDVVFGYSYLVHGIVLNFDQDSNWAAIVASQQVLLLLQKLG